MLGSRGKKPQHNGRVVELFGRLGKHVQHGFLYSTGASLDERRAHELQPEVMSSHGEASLVLFNPTPRRETVNSSKLPLILKFDYLLIPPKPQTHKS